MYEYSRLYLTERIRSHSSMSTAIAVSMSRTCVCTMRILTETPQQPIRPIYIALRVCLAP